MKTRVCDKIPQAFFRIRTHTRFEKFAGSEFSVRAQRAVLTDGRRPAGRTEYRDVRANPLGDATSNNKEALCLFIIGCRNPGTELNPRAQSFPTEYFAPSAHPVRQNRLELFWTRAAQPWRRSGCRPKRRSARMRREIPPRGRHQKFPASPFVMLVFFRPAWEPESDRTPIKLSWILRIRLDGARDERDIAAQKALVPAERHRLDSQGARRDYPSARR